MSRRIFALIGLFVALTTAAAWPRSSQPTKAVATAVRSGSDRTSSKAEVGPAGLWTGAV